MRRIVIPAVVLLSALALGGCSAAPSSLPESSAFTESSAGADMPQQFAPGTPEMVDQSASMVDAASRQVIVTGTVTLTVEHPVDAAVAAAQIVERAGGRIDSRSEIAPDETSEGSAQLTVRIPTEKLTATLESLKQLGEVVRVDQAEQDVTSQAQDLDARITALRTSVDRLITLMASADTTADLISIEAALSERQSNLEALESQQRSLDDQVQMSTFTVYLGSEEDAPVVEPDTFLSGLIAGWNAFVGFFSFLLVAVGVLLPWLALVAVALLVTLFVVRRRRKATPHEPSHPTDGSVIV